MEIIKAEIIKKFSDLKEGDHVIAIGDRNSQHGIYIGTSEGVMNFGTDEIDRNRVSEKMDLFVFARCAQNRLVRINYDMEKCIDPLKSSSNALKTDLFDANESGAQKAIKCKLGKSATEQTLEYLQRGIHSIMEGYFQQKGIEQMAKVKNDLFWFWR